MATETFLVTGASRGIGLELVRQLLASDHNVIATCRDPHTATALSALGPSDSLRIEPLEVTDGESVARLAKALNGECIDVLINNAGIMGGPRQSLGAMDYAAWAEAFDVNAIAPFRIIEALLPSLRRARRPRVVTLSSQMGALSRQSTGSFAYRSSKAAVNKVMQVLALELREDQIVVCPVHPGWVRTDMGGASADISVEESASGLLQLIDNLSMEHSGRFWTWNGQEHEW